MFYRSATVDRHGSHPGWHYELGPRHQLAPAVGPGTYRGHWPARILLGGAMHHPLGPWWKMWIGVALALSGREPGRSVRIAIGGPVGSLPWEVLYRSAYGPRSDRYCGDDLHTLPALPSSELY